MKRFVGIGVVLALSLFAVRGTAAPENKTPQYLVSVRVLDVEVPDEWNVPRRIVEPAIVAAIADVAKALNGPVVPRVIAEPAIVVEVGKPFQFFSGGEVPSKATNDAVEFGVSLRGQLHSHEGDRFALSATLADNHRYALDANGDDVVMVRGETYDVRLTLALGEERRIACGGSRVVVIRVDFDSKPLGP